MRAFVRILKKPPGLTTNSNRKIGDDTIKGGLIGLMNRYSSRDNKSLVNRQPKIWPPNFKVWGSTIS